MRIVMGVLIIVLKKELMICMHICVYMFVFSFPQTSFQQKGFLPGLIIGCSPSLQAASWDHLYPNSFSLIPSAQILAVYSLTFLRFPHVSSLTYCKYPLPAAAVARCPAVQAARRRVGRIVSCTPNESKSQMYRFLKVI